MSAAASCSREKGAGIVSGDGRGKIQMSLGRSPWAYGAAISVAARGFLVAGHLAPLAVAFLVPGSPIQNPRTERGSPCPKSLITSTAGIDTL